MDYKSHFSFLLNYNLWANNNVANTLLENKLDTGKPIELFSHIINAEIIWLGRIKNISDFRCKPFEVRNINEFNKLFKSINEEWIEFVLSLQENDFNNLIKYRNLKGEDCISKIWEIATHMINHSTYHRAQIASAVRSMNIQPAVTDLIGYARLNKI